MTLFSNKFRTSSDLLITMDIGLKFKFRKSKNIETVQVAQKRLKYAPKSSKTTNFRNIQDRKLLNHNITSRFQISSS